MSLQYNLDQDNVATITMDMPGRSVNVINKEFFDSFQETPYQYDFPDSSEVR